MPIRSLRRTAGSHAAALVLGAAASWAAAAPVAAAHGGSRWQVLTRAAVSPGVRSDGLRYAVFAVGGGSVAILDSLTGKRLRQRTPAGCTAGQLPIVGAGLLVWTCQPDGVRDAPVVFSIEKRRFVRVRGLRALWADMDRTGAEAAIFRGVGRRRIEVEEVGNHLAVVRYLDWRRGALLAEPGSPRRTVGLSSPHAVRRMCAPLVRDRVGGYAISGEPPFFPFVYEPPYAYSLGRPSVLQRCGDGRRARLSGCAGRCELVQLAGGRISWLGRDRVYLSRAGDAFARRKPSSLALPSGAPVDSVAHAARFVFVGSDGVVYRARL